MNIKLLKPYGYCPGVINAIKEVKKLRKDNPTENIYMFGRLIHNELIDSLMNELNIKVIDCEYDKYFEYINKLNIGDIVILSAHGHEKSLEKALFEKGILFIDTTCSWIKTIHNKILKHKDHEIIYIGKSNHIEAVTTSLLTEHTYFYDIQKGFINGRPITNNPYVFYQSTITNDTLNKALDDLKNNYEKIKVYKCSCPQCKLRQNILSAEINEKTFLILVGSKTSSNTNSLLEIYQKITKSNNFIIVNSFDEITKLEINPEFDYLITSGTSTPNKTVLDIFKYLRSL